MYGNGALDKGHAVKESGLLFTVGLQKTHKEVMTNYSSETDESCPRDRWEIVGILAILMRSL